MVGGRLFIIQPMRGRFSNIFLTPSKGLKEKSPLGLFSSGIGLPSLLGTS